VTNAGVLERQSSFFGPDQPIALRYGKDDDDKCYKITDVYYATPHVTSGCLYPISGMTVDGSLKFTFNPVTPIVSEATNEKFADAFIALLETVSSPPAVATQSSDAKPWENVSLPKGILTKATLALGLLAVSTHANAFSSFIQSVLEMKANVANPEDFWAALNFWIFFAVGHPLLQPILSISDVLHGSPGPLIAGLVPLTFLLGNVVVLTAIAVSSEVRMNYSNYCTALNLIVSFRSETPSILLPSPPFSPTWELGWMALLVWEISTSPWTTATRDRSSRGVRRMIKLNWKV
jgi:hypothetical protein